MSGWKYRRRVSKTSWASALPQFSRAKKQSQEGNDAKSEGRRADGGAPPVNPQRKASEGGVVGDLPLLASEFQVSTRIRGTLWTPLSQSIVEVGSLRSGAGWLQSRHQPFLPRLFKDDLATLLAIVQYLGDPSHGSGRNMAVLTNKPIQSPNFSFLGKHDEVLVRHAAPGELLCQHTAAYTGIRIEERTSAWRPLPFVFGHSTGVVLVESNGCFILLASFTAATATLTVGRSRPMDIDAIETSLNGLEVFSAGTFCT